MDTIVLPGGTMSKIDELIKQLQEKKKKIDYIEYIKELLTGDQKCIDFVEVQEDVLSKIVPLLNQVAKEIEDGVSSTVTATSGNSQLSDDQIKTLALLADKAVKKMTPRPQDAHPQLSKKESGLSNKEKMDFALSNRHLANKKVLVGQDNADPVPGTVVGLDAPYVVVRGDNGQILQVSLEKITIER